MSYYAPSIEKLIESFEKLPSIGNKTAARLAFHILDASEEETNEFIQSIINAKKNLKYCSKCFNISDTSVSHPDLPWYRHMSLHPHSKMPVSFSLQSENQPDTAARSARSVHPTYVDFS